MLSFNIYADSIYIEKEPLCMIYTPESILDANPSTDGIRYVGDKPRYSTCSGVSWFNDSIHLITVNMHDSSLNIYKFDNQKNEIFWIKKYTNMDGIDLNRPENIEISNQGDLIIVPNMSSDKIQIYKTNLKDDIYPKPIATIQNKKNHGIKLSRDNNFFAVTSMTNGISIYNAKTLQLAHNFLCPCLPLKPKSIDFSFDDKFIIISYCVELSRNMHTPKGIISVYKFNSKNGIIDHNPVSEIDTAISAETLKFHPSEKAFFFTDQANSGVIGCEFNNKNGKIGESWVALDAKNSKLNIPHGIAFSRNGKNVAVTNCGDDKLNIYKVNSF